MGPDDLPQLLAQAKKLSKNIHRREFVDLYRKALFIGPTDENKTELANALRNLGHGKYYEKKYEEARRAFIEAADLYSALGDAEAEEEYKVRKSKGRCEGFLGDHDSSIETFGGLTDILKDIKISGGGKLDADEELGKINFYLSIAYAKKGMWQKALTSVRSAKKSLKGSNYFGFCLQGEGVALTELGDYDEAIKVLTRAKKCFADSAYKTANIDENISKCLHRQGMYEEAVKLLDGCIAAYESEGIPRQWAYFHRGVSRESLGQNAQARADYSRAIEIIETTRGDIGADVFRKTYLAQNLLVYDYAILNALSLGKTAEAYDLIQCAKARGFSEKLELGFNVSGKHGAEWDELNALRDKIDGLFAAINDVDSRKMADFKGLKKLENDYSRLLRRIKEKDPENVESVFMTPMPISEIQEIMDVHTAIIDYYVTSEKLIIFVITKKGADYAVISEKRENIVEMAEGVKLWIMGIEKAVLSEDSELKEEGLEWYLDGISKILFAPVEKFIKEVRRIIFVPHLSLHYLPFALLKTSDGKKIIEKHETVNIPSPRLLKRIKESEIKPLASALLIANPLCDLKFSDEEAGVIAEIVPKAKILSGAAAKKEEILKLMGSGDFCTFHFSCHCRVSYDSHDFTGLLVAGKKKNEVARIELNELLEIKHKADLVVLSGCETGIGDAPLGDEITSLPRAFIYGGAAVVVVSLWEVDDRSTSEFMGHFYRGLCQKMQVSSTAMRNAQLKLMEKYSPYHWAAFQIIGY